MVNNFFFLLALSFGAGVVTQFAVAPFNFWFLPFLTLPVLYYCLLRVDGAWRALLTAWLFWFGYFVFSLVWIGNALMVEGNEAFLWAYPLAVAGLPIVLALFPALCLTFIYRKFNLEYLGSWMGFVAALGIAEVLRGYLFTGFPWNNIGYTWLGLPSVAQTASIGGIYFLSALSYAWFSLPALYFMHKKGPVLVIVILVITASFAGSWYWGGQRLAEHPPRKFSDVNIHLIQPNIPQHEKWNRELIWSHFNNTANLSAKALEGNRGDDDINLFVWPETAVTSNLLAYPESREIMRRFLKPGREDFLATGILRFRGEGDARTYYNSLGVINSDLEVQNIYNKSHLVPFGEYIPFQEYIPLEPVVAFSGFQAGNGPKNMVLSEDLEISPLICYEIIFPGRAMPRTGPRPALIVNVTNDAWYGNSAGPRQHLAQAVFRAIETGVPVARAANTGISALIDPYGREVTRIPLMRTGQVTANLPHSTQNKTPFANYPYHCWVALLALYLILAFLWRRD